MRVPRLLLGLVVAMAALSAGASAPTEAGTLHRRMADVNLELYATWSLDDEHIRMKAHEDDRSQWWTIIRAYTSLTTTIGLPWPDNGCWAVDESAVEGAPLRLEQPCVAGRRPQQWWMTAYTDGVTFRSVRVDLNHLCAGFLPNEPEPVLRQLRCDENDPNQRFALPPRE